jgi:DNA-binding transcriptional regulator YdaS (Cro superfamily)
MSAVPEIVTKAEFASLLGVSRPAVSQYISEKKISGAALVGSGHRAKINIAIARRQLNKNLDVVRHNSLSGKARVTGPIADIDDLPVEHCDVGVEESIKQERLRQLELGNGKLQDEANARAGLYVLADDMRQELGIIVTRVLTEVEAFHFEAANAIAARGAVVPADILKVMRETWREVRARASKAYKKEAVALAGSHEGVADGPAR